MNYLFLKLLCFFQTECLQNIVGQSSAYDSCFYFQHLLKRHTAIFINIGCSSTYKANCAIDSIIFSWCTHTITATSCKLAWLPRSIFSSVSLYRETMNTLITDKRTGCKIFGRRYDIRVAASLFLTRYVNYDWRCNFNQEPPNNTCTMYVSKYM